MTMIASTFRVLRLFRFIPQVRLILWTVFQSLEVHSDIKWNRDSISIIQPTHSKGVLVKYISIVTTNFWPTGHRYDGKCIVIYICMLWL